MREDDREDFEDAQEIGRQRQQQRTSTVPMKEWKPGRGLQDPSAEEKARDDVRRQV